MADLRAHWENVFKTKAEDEVSWYESKPGLSLTLAREAISQGARSLIDIGGGASHLVDALLDEQLDRITVLDISETALAKSRERLGIRADDVQWLSADVTQIDDVGAFDVWHDRAVFHFLIADKDRQHYRALAERTISKGGRAIIATFGPEGPERCSGLDVHRYGARDLANELGPGFSLVRSEITNHATPAGKHQQFLYAAFERA